jgi:hypothetical protein
MFGNFIYRWGLVIASVVVFILNVFSNWGQDDFPSYGVWISILLAIGQVIMLEVELYRIVTGYPILSYKNYWTETKLVTALRNELFPSPGGIPTTDTASEDFGFVQRIWKNEYEVVGITIANEPQNRNKYSYAEGVLAHITFFTPKGKVFKQGRWWSGDTRLFPPQKLNLDSLRKAKITPGDPIRLVIAYKVKDGNLFYPFDYKTHFQAAEQRKKENLGKNNIEFHVVFEGENIKPTRPLKFILVDSQNGIEIKGK